MNKKSLTLLVIAVVVVVGVIFAGALTMQKKTEAVTCSQKGAQHMMTIKNGVVSPTHTAGKLCDTMKITNTDPETREIGFGAHDHHEAYDGVSEKILRKDQSFTVTFTKKGEYHFHDHFHEETAGSFTVN